MFQELNRESGITVVLVTHDAEVARHARRIIRIHDGTIVDDAPVAEPLTESVPASPHLEPKAAPA
jgi:ABC-type lipoprotein export system ATPase subunit